MRKLRLLFGRYLSFDLTQRALVGYFRSTHARDEASSCTVLIQCVEDLFYFGLFGRILASLRQEQAIRVEQFILRSLNVGESRSLLALLTARLVKNSVHTSKWRLLYGSVCDGVAYSSTSFRPIADLADLYKAWKCWRNLPDKDALISLAIQGVNVGDLVNDSFIRFKPAPTVSLRDSYLWLVLWQAHRDVRRAKEYFTHRKPQLFLTSYSSYIQHGIPVRVALQNGVRVFTFGEYQEFAKELSTRDWFHTIDPDPLAADFAKMSQQQEKLAIAEAALSTRLKGGIDAATVYMKKSAYAESGEAVPDVAGAVIVFLHDFYDSPYIYRDMVFPDFWEWVCFTIETMQKARIKFHLKPHPNQIELNDDVLQALQLCYPDISIISSKISNTQLVKGGIAAGVTIYGSVVNEMAYLGVPTIACSRHPHSSFDFCATARTREEYATLLRNHAVSRVDATTMREQSLIFYYMFNFGRGEAEKQLTDAVMKYRLACTDGSDGASLVQHLQAIAACPAYKERMRNWSSGLAAGDV